MALSPREVERLVRKGVSLSDEEKQIADGLETIIDARLPLMYRRGRVIRPPFHRFVSRRVVEELGRRYSKSGWHVDVEPPMNGSPGFKLALTARRQRLAGLRAAPMICAY